MPYDINTGVTSYNQGDLIRIQATFKDLTGNLVDPTAVTLKVKVPAGTVTTYNHPGTIVRSSVGVFYFDFAVNASGTHYFNWSGTGAYTAADESSFEVATSVF
jgi:hypothetical protein